MLDRCYRYLLKHGKNMAHLAVSEWVHIYFNICFPFLRTSKDSRWLPHPIWPPCLGKTRWLLYNCSSAKDIQIHQQPFPIGFCEFIIPVSLDQENGIIFQERVSDLNHMTFGLLYFWWKVVSSVNTVFHICQKLCNFLICYNKGSPLFSIYKKVFNWFFCIFTFSVIFISALRIPPCLEWVHQ